MSTENRKEVFIKYLLGTASESERDDVELSFVDDEYFDAFLVTEHNLITDYLRQKLTPKEKTLFEENYLKDSPENAKKVLIATAEVDVFSLPTLTGPASLPAPTVSAGWRQMVRGYFRPYWVTGFASAASALVITLLFGYPYLAALRQEAEQLRGENERLRGALQEERTRAEEELAKVQRSLEEANERIKTTASDTGQVGVGRDNPETASRQDKPRDELAGRTQRSPVSPAPSPRPAEEASTRDIYAESSGAVLGPVGTANNPQIVTGAIKKIRVHLLLRPGLPGGPYKVKMRLAGGAERILEGLRAGSVGRGKAITIQLRPEEVADGNNIFYVYAREPDGSYPAEADEGYVIRLEKR